ncbi:MAG: hypothetical protein IT239_04580, partial [Bacteroidia bacterium]|nr:hypothetical protein [Bacteroidia bacterium]
MNELSNDSQDLINSIIQDLRSNEKYKAFFSKYNPTAVDEFITGFAFTKSMYVRYADMYQQEKERASLGLLPQALSCLEKIQQKKLFDKQCLWRAGKIELPGVTNTFHFLYWENYVLACPFIEPISDDDVELFMQYVSSSNEDSADFLIGYQDYDEFKEAMNTDNGGVYPDWYEFYDTYRGTGVNIQLPNIKGEREEFYRQLHFQNKREEEIKNGTYKPFNESGQLPFLSSFDDKQVEEFIKSFGDSKEIELWKNYLESKNNNNDQFVDAVHFLSEARELVPIEAHSDYREAIIKSAQLYRSRLLARALPLAFEEYQMKLKTGIS